MKVLRVIAKTYGFVDKFEDFKLKHSMILNNRHSYGELCLSIHPMDYITMSDNDSDWHSCMSWTKPGECRMGTVEMMNSKYVVVGYLKSQKDMDLENGYFWNNKKWRELFIVDKNIITEIKGYPYQSDELTRACLNWLRELAQTNLNWEYKDTTDLMLNKFNTVSTDNEKIAIEFDTDNMYNDFGAKVGGHHCYLSNKLTEGVYINYSGMTECVICGKEIMRSREIYDNSGQLVCRDCLRPIACYSCGNVEENMTMIDGIYLCEDCVEYSSETDALTNERHFYENLQNVWVYRGSELISSFDVYKDYNLDFLDRDGYLKPNRKVRNDEGVNCLDIDDLTEKGIAAFVRK